MVHKSTPPARNNLYGIVLMIMNSLVISILYSTNKYLTQFMDAAQVVLLYKLILLMGIWPFLLVSSGNFARTKKIKLHMLRALLSSAGSVFFSYGLSKVGVLSATALGKVEQILLVIVGVLYFGEQMRPYKIVVVLSGFLGATCVVWAGGNGHHTAFNSGYIYVILSVLLWTCNSSLVKVLGKTESSRTQLFYVSLFSVLLLIPSAHLKWNWPTEPNVWLPSVVGVGDYSMLSPHIIQFLCLMALCYLAHVLCFFKSLKIADLSIVIPFDYSRVVFSGILGYLLFQEIPSSTALIGYFLIIFAGIYLLKKEAQARKKFIVEEGRS